LKVPQNTDFIFNNTTTEENDDDENLLKSDEKYSRSKLMEECEGDSTPINNLKLTLTENYNDSHNNISDVNEVLQDQDSIIDELMQIGQHQQEESGNFDQTMTQDNPSN
jgi:hypothetical protein